jgi:hypothetical protein
LVELERKGVLSGWILELERVSKSGGFGRVSMSMSVD